MEQIKANGYDGKYDIVMKFAQVMLHRRGLDSFVNERRAQMAKNKIRAANNQTELNEHQIMSMQYFNWPLEPLTSRVDGVMLLSVSAST
jgi:hypothetical protein